MTTKTTEPTKKSKCHKIEKNNAETSVEQVEQIKKLHNEIMNAEATALEKAIYVGELLVAQKEKAGHKNWQKWIDEKEIGFSSRTASRYMKLAKNKEKIKNKESIRNALELLQDEPSKNKSSEKKSVATKP